MRKYFRFLSPFFQKEHKFIILICIFVILSQIFSLLEPFFYARIIDKFLRDFSAFPSSSVYFKALSFTVLGWIGVAFASRIFKNFEQYWVQTVSDRIGINLFNRAYSHVIALPMSFHASQKTGEVFRKISKARDDVTAFFSVLFDKIFQNGFAILAVMVYIFVRQWRLGLLVLVLVPVFVFTTFALSKRLKKIQSEINKINEKLFGTSVEALNHIEVVKSFATESHETDQVAHDNLVSHQNLKRKTLALQYLLFAQGTIVNFARVSLIWWGAVLAFKGMLTFADVIMFSFYSFVIYQPLYDLGDVITKYQDGVSAVDRLQTILSEKVEIESKPGAFAPEKLEGKVEFKNVSFKYNNERDILENISFAVEPGDRLALVGLSGSGKSTIVKLLLRFYQPTEGQILIDNVPIEEYDLTALHKRIGLVLQDNILFNTTLEDNIRYGTFEAPQEEVQKSSSRAFLDAFVQSLPNGLKTIVGERGIKLSGGEKQRVAIARSIIKKPDILIFDEATSSLDSHSEEMIKQAIDKVSHGVTTITVAHRFATVINSDEIILLEGGRILERGTHKSLLRKGGKYAHLYKLQTQRQELEEVF